MAVAVPRGLPIILVLLAACSPPPGPGGRGVRGAIYNGKPTSGHPMVGELDLSSDDPAGGGSPAPDQGSEASPSGCAMVAGAIAGSWPMALLLLGLALLRRTRRGAPRSEGRRAR